MVAEYVKDVPPGKYLCFEAAIASAVPLGSVSGWIDGGGGGVDVDYRSALLFPNTQNPAEGHHQTKRQSQTTTTITTKSINEQGLSSSASLEVGFATFLEQILGAIGLFFFAFFILSILSYLSIHPSILFIYLIYLSIHPFLHPIYRSIDLFMYLIYLIYLSILSIDRSIYLSIYLSIHTLIKH